MSDPGPPTKSRKFRFKLPSEQDVSLWDQAMRDVKRLFGSEPRAADMPPDLPMPSHPVAPRPSDTAPRSAAVEKQQAASPGDGLDKRTEQKFRQGKMQIEGRLDLHGMTVVQAHASVRHFIQSHFARQSRCLLVITGKGQARTDTAFWEDNGSGKIKRSFSQWLGDADLKPLILSVTPARPQHGGAGAFYVLLRRQR